MSVEPVVDREGLEKRLDNLRVEITRRRALADPVDWITTRLGEHIWSKQRQIVESVRDNRRTAVPSCHEAGKSYIAARIVAWWLENYAPGEAFVVTSAPTGAQVKAILWREINRAQSKGLRGRTNQTEWYMTVPSGKEELVAFGRKPADYDPAAFQGIHARYVLVVFDEACGIPSSLWDAADSLIANENSRFLAIGNPDDSSSEFANVCKPGSGWNVISISAFDTPNFTGEPIEPRLKDLLVSPLWQQEKLRKWGDKNPLYIAKVLGRFPETTVGGLIPISWIRAAQQRDLTPKTEEERAAAESWDNELGVDVGGGGDKNVAAHRRGPIVRIIRRDQEPDTMVSCGNMLVDMDQTGVTVAKVDYIGIGKGMVDRAREQGRPVVGVNVGKEPKDKEQFANLKVEGWWAVRERFQDGNVDIDPDDEDLAAQLVELQFKRSSSGKIIMESKDDMKRRLGHSPDDADALMLACMPKHLLGMQEIEIREAVWG